jgi:hypothetical protein
LDHCGEEARETLDAVRHEYLQRYADAQMIIPEEVFAAAIYANNGLSRLYGIVGRLDGLTIIDLNSRTTAEEGQEETINSAFLYLENVRKRIWKLRGVMRSNLGINPAPELKPDSGSEAEA